MHIIIINRLIYNKILNKHLVTRNRVTSVDLKFRQKNQYLLKELLTIFFLYWPHYKASIGHFGYSY